MSIDLPPVAPPPPKKKRGLAEKESWVTPLPVESPRTEPPVRQKQRPQRWWGKLLVFSIALIAVISGGVAWIRLAAEPKVSKALTYSVRRGDMTVSVTEQGTVESSNNTEIKCKVRGWSNVIWVIEAGSVVQAGDELVRLDTKQIEDAISLQTTNTHTSRATLERTKANVRAAEIAIDAYLQGRYKSQLKALEKDLAIAQSNLVSAKKMLASTEAMFKRGYVSDLEVKGNRFTLTQAQLELKVRQTAIDVLKKYTRAMELESLNGRLAAAKSKLLADEAGLKMDSGRLDRAKEELEQCVVRAPSDGLVIHPLAAAWKETPDITEGANVRKDQVLLLMPDLTKMQVKVGVHESMVERVQPGQLAKVTLPELDIQGNVETVASVAQPTGWWTGNVVKYDTVIQLPETQGLKPGMSAEVEIVLAEHKNVLTVPVSSVVETEDGDFVWVSLESGTLKRPVQLGDSNDVFVIVESGLTEGENVVLNPVDFIEEAEESALQTIDEADTPNATS